MRRIGQCAIVFGLLLATATGCRAPAVAPTPAAPALPTSASVGGTNIVAISPPAQQCCPKQTLPQFLGITGLARGVGGLLDRLRNRLGSIWPGLEAKPEILSISDPANMESDNPAISAAAEAKAAEDEAAQKAKAIMYLGKIGCAGCYPGIEDAILAALDDCTEEVRFGAAKALRTSATMPCKNCCRSACCGPKVREKLTKIAYETDSQGCYFESSDRVRRMARLALANCTCVPDKPGQSPDRLPAEGPSAADAAPATANAPTPAAPIASVLKSPLAQYPAPQLTSPAAHQPVTEPTVRRASLEEVIAAYSDPRTVAPAEDEVAYEIWTAPRGMFRSVADAQTTMTIARTQVMSGQPVYSSSQLLQQTRGWMVASASGSPALAAAASTTPVGGVSGIVEDHTGWHVIRVLGRRPRVALPPPQPAMVPAQPMVVPVSYQPNAAVPAPAAGGPRVVAVRLRECDCK
jgi:hypothetical protein